MDIVLPLYYGFYQFINTLWCRVQVIVYVRCQMNKLKYGVALFLLCGAYTAQASATMSIKDAFYNAAVMGKTHLIRQYINQGYNIDTPDSSGMTAMCYAKIKKNTRAYNILVHFGANPHASCAMQQVKQNIKDNWKWYALGGAAAVGAIAGIAAFSSGGSGGSGGGGGSDTSGGVTVVDADDTFTAYTSKYIEDSVEYSGKAFDSKASSAVSKNVAPYIRPVNFLGSVNAASAFSKFYGFNEDGSLATTLKGKDLIVGVMDSGVHPNHREFLYADGSSKVFGHNFDYGPCNGSDKSNCWKAVGDPFQYGLAYYQEVQLLDSDGKAIEATYVSAITSNPYKVWASDYSSDYDWDKLQDDPSPAKGHDSDTHEELLHGTNVAGIIAANWNRSDSGMMGVAFSNTKIDAVRWDFMSNYEKPFNALIKDGANVTNLSLGIPSVKATSINEKDYIDMLEEDGWLPSMRNIMKKYTYENDAIDGMILTKAAGNEGNESSLTQPDILSATKLLDEFKDLLMMVVVAVDVSFNDDGSVKSYRKSSFSNGCGVTAGYCISAPGGSYFSSGDYSQLFSTGDPVTGYIGMAGTSQATPVVTGSIAFLKNAYPYMKASQIIELLRTTANTNGQGYNSSDHTDTTYGAGLLDLGNAVSTYIPPENSGISTFSGNSVSTDDTMSLSDMHLVVPSAYASALGKALPKTITAFDKYNRPFAFPTANYISSTHGSYKTLKNDVMNISRRQKIKHFEQDGLRFDYSEAMSKGNKFGLINAEFKHGNNVSGFYLSENTRYTNRNNASHELNNPFMSFTSAYGMHNTYNFNQNIAWKAEVAGGRNAMYDGDKDFSENSFKKQAYALNSELQLHKDKNFAFGLSAGMLYEDEAMLGMNGRGALAVASGETYHSGVTASWFATNKLTFSGSYYQGYTKAQKFASNLLKTSNLVSDSFAFDANYQWDKSFDLGLTLSSPLRINKGSLAVNFPRGRDNYSDTVYREQYKAGLKPERREYKFAVYANKDISDDLSLRSEFDVRVNPEHQKADNDYRALFGMSYNF